MTQAVVQTTVTGLQGRPVANAAPAASQSLTWNGSAWAAAGPFLPLTGGTVSGPVSFTGGLSVAGNASFGAVTVNTLQANNNITGSANITGLGVYATAGRMLCSSAGGGPSLTVYDTSQNVAYGMYVVTTANQCTIASMNGTGAPSVNLFSFNLAGNFWPNSNNTQQCGFAGQAWFAVGAYQFVTESDPRLKKDIAPSPAGALGIVNEIAVQNFRWNEDAETAPLHIGWMADKVQAAVGLGSATVVIGEDANKTLALNATEMTAILWQAVQELSAEVAAMKPATPAT